MTADPGPSPLRSGLRAAAERAADFLDALPSRHVGATASPAELLRAMDRPFPETGTPADEVLRELADDADGGLVASAGPRYFGFVIGGSTHASLMADWLASAWDQNAQAYATSPAAATAESVAARWLVELLGLPARSSVGFTTGGQMSNLTALLCARNTVLERAGWDLDKNGLFGAPPVTVFMSEQGHATVRSALRMLGFGAAQVREIPADREGRMKPALLEEEVRRAAGKPMIVSLQAGNVHTGAFEPIAPVADLLKGQNAWLHVDGAFGLWAAVSPGLRGLLQGLERADSWATDAHKWLNVPYDSGLVIVKDPALHRRVKTSRCAYAGEASEDRRDGSTWVPENSRRARGFALYAALREQGRSGVRSIVERCCAAACTFAREAARLPGARILNEVVLNQVLVRFDAPPQADPHAFHRAVAARVQSGGRCWLGTTTWQGATVLRVSVSNWTTDEADIMTTLQALEEAVRHESRQGCPSGL